MHNNAAHKLLPPLLFIVLAIAMAGICWALGSPHLIAYPFAGTGAILLAAGLGIAIYHSRLFKRVGANILTFNQPTHLVTTGLFRHTRNPMYLGLALALFGIAILFQGAPSSLLLALAFVIICDRWYIRYEEQAMQQRFGEQYRQYCQSTPRWL